MKTVKLFLEETLKYRREVVIGVPDTFTDKDLEQLFDKTTRESEQSADVPYVIERVNPEIAIIEYPDSDLDSPDQMEVEIEEWDTIE